MKSMSVTAAVSQLERSWFKALAPWNMANMSVTAAVSQLEMSPLKSVAFKNMPSMSVTAAVFQLERSWLKALAFSNIQAMSVTAAVSQLEISALNSPAPLNSSYMSVTRLTSQSLIGIPSCRQSAPVGSAARQLLTAAFSAAPSGKAAPVAVPPQIRQEVVPSAPTPVAVQGLCAQSVMAGASIHMFSLSVTAITSQLERSWLKALALLNMY